MAYSAFGWLRELGREFRHAGRRLRRQPAFWLASTLTLGLGVGITTAVASLTDAMLFKPQPGVADPDRLIAVYSDSPSTPQIEFLGVSHPEYLDLRAAQDLVDLGAFVRQPFILAHSDATSAEVIGDYVSGTYFPVLGAVPAAGRLLSPLGR